MVGILIRVIFTFSWKVHLNYLNIKKSKKKNVWFVQARPDPITIWPKGETLGFL